MPTRKRLTIEHLAATVEAMEQYCAFLREALGSMEPKTPVEFDVEAFRIRIPPLLWGGVCYASPFTRPTRTRSRVKKAVKKKKGKK